MLCCVLLGAVDRNTDEPLASDFHSLSCVKELVGWFDLDLAGLSMCAFGLRQFHRTGYLQQRRSQPWRRARLVPTGTYAIPFHTQHPLGVVVKRPSVWPDR